MTDRFKFYIEDSLLYAEEFFQSLGEIVRFKGRTVTAEQIKDADFLLTRSTTQVNADLLADNNKLRFVGTATAGYNHIDADYLTEKGIPWAPAAGCNADAVCDYVLSSCLNIANKYRFELAGKKVAVVGVGQIGQRLLTRLAALGCEVLAYDPVRADLDKNFESAAFDEVLTCDIITCHVPFTEGGRHPTKHMFNKDTLGHLKPGAILINACRGEVIDNQALLNVFMSGQDLKVVLDVFENEPNIEAQLLPWLEFATPHIAGHSLEGKARGTEILYQKVCKMLGLEANIRLADLLPGMAIDSINMTDNYQLSQRQYRAMINLVYDIRNDDIDFKTGMQQSKNSFEYLRKNYAIRRELTSLKLYCDQMSYTIFKDLGFNAQLKD
ncbi:4-phosphoerythronate dehydrogenase [Gayadomonas joobiniege]|uniref:4-phosphoerythronate dehydrogenase n=1 Tax=Gayadomonas joobiniege TaxID=1234606 RepID=UPI000377ABE2|nr:4-phosphoerythronate dehydrogenase [Gayadomonas joobiniege]